MPRTLYLVLSGAAAPEGAVELVGPPGPRLAGDGAVHPQRRGLPRPGPVGGSDGRAGPRRLPDAWPGQALPPADVVLACPLTFNSTNKFAQGLADNFAIALLCEMVGYGVPTVVVPHCKSQLATHPAFTRSLETLRGMEPVTVLHDADAPYEGRLPSWQRVIDTVNGL